MEDCCWPDNVSPGCPMLNDVSRLNATVVHSIVQPRTLDDVRGVVLHARQVGKRVSLRGTTHSMGGQSLVHDGVVVDMAFVRHMRYDPATCTVTVGTGATWADVIRHLNPHGKAPRTLQSYCSFSVGGTLAVNGHGITTDYCMAESVVSFTVVLADGRVVHVDRSNEHSELFGLCLGGYGLFGIIYEVTLKVDDNVRLSMDAMSVPVADVPHLYEGILQDPHVQMKLARLDTTTLDTADLFIFRQASSTPTVSALPCKPREMTTMGRLMYKWLAGPLREARFALERQLGSALDWAQVSDRNEMLFESAAPLARLYSPLVAVDDTFILQEYFVPRESCVAFITGIKPHVLHGINKEASVTLLNITMRFVRQDTDTGLPYARHASGMYAFVFYFRLRRTPEADAILHGYHTALAGVSLGLGGTFYLPYRHHYTPEELLRAYPTFPAFCEAKLWHEPTGLFGNL